jgi:hypothetical protein
MSILRTLLAFLLLAPGIALAEKTTLPIPGQSWVIQFDSPSLQRLDESKGANAYSYLGNADRLNVSLFVSNPTCKGGDNSDARYACFVERAGRNPILVPGTIRRADAPNGLQVAYVVKTEVEGRTFTALNLHVLLMHSGKEVDLHASFVQPEDADLDILLALVNSVRIVEATPTP